MAKNNNKQKPPNTLLSSQTTHPRRPRIQPATLGRVLVERAVRGLPHGSLALGGQGRVATASPSYVRENSQSNDLLIGVFRVQHVLRPFTQRARRRQYSACRGAAPAIARRGSTTAAAPTP